VRDLPPKLAASWKGPLVTYLYSTLLSVGYTSLSVSLIAVPALNMAAAGGPSSRLAAVAAAAVAAAARFLYIYLGMVWAGGEAVRARRAQGFLIALALAVANASVGFGGSGRGALGWRDALACAVRILLGMFSPMVYTVFYHECKRSHGDGAPKELSHRTKAEHDHGTSSEGVV
jgi:hypothetical protein